MYSICSHGCSHDIVACYKLKLPVPCSTVVWLALRTALVVGLSHSIATFDFGPSFSFSKEKKGRKNQNKSSRCLAPWTVFSITSTSDFKQHIGFQTAIQMTEITTSIPAGHTNVSNYLLVEIPAAAPNISRTFSFVLKTPHAVPLVIPISPTGAVHPPPTRTCALRAPTTGNQFTSRVTLTNTCACWHVGLTWGQVLDYSGVYSKLEWRRWRWWEYCGRGHRFGN